MARLSTSWRYLYDVGARERRADAVMAALDDARAEGHFWAPIREMTRVAVEPLPGLDDFLPQWRSVGGHSCLERPERMTGRASADRWLSEVTHRLEGTEGLARLARKTRRAHDLRAWCSAVRRDGRRLGQPRFVPTMGAAEANIG